MTLRAFFEENPKIAIAFSGGCDSSYLLYAATRYAKRVRAYFVKTEFQPKFELDDALRLAAELDADLKVLRLSALTEREVRENPKNRCYFCKKLIFGEIKKAAAADGFTVIADGTNASDDADDRPGMTALSELSVVSPLRLCGITKEELRRLSREAGLFTWDKPDYACLATRIAQGEEITKENLRAVEEAEQFLFSLGFKDFRVRARNKDARIELSASQMGRLIDARTEIASKLKKYFRTVSLDLEARDEH